MWFGGLFARALRKASEDLAKEAGRVPDVPAPPPAPEEKSEEPTEPKPDKPEPPKSEPLRCNEAGLEIIKRFEGLRLKAYLCPADVWTIGYGHTRTAKPGMTITEAEADELLLEDLETFENGVWERVKHNPTHINEFSACVSLAFNIGLAAFGRSTVLKRHLAGNKLGAADAFMLWVKAGGKVLPGLVKRRDAERNLYLS